MLRAVTLFGIALLALVLSTDHADGATSTRLDREAGVRLTLEGKELTGTIVAQPNRSRSPTIERELFGERVRMACGTSFRDSRGIVVTEAGRWPDGARSAAGGGFPPGVALSSSRVGL
jgi:hypothetical protein